MPQRAMQTRFCGGQNVLWRIFRLRICYNVAYVPRCRGYAPACRVKWFARKLKTALFRLPCGRYALWCAGVAVVSFFAGGRPVSGGSLRLSAEMCKAGVISFIAVIL